MYLIALQFCYFYFVFHTKAIFFKKLAIFLNILNSLPLHIPLFLYLFYPPSDFELSKNTNVYFTAEMHYLKKRQSFIPITFLFRGLWLT